MLEEKVLGKGVRRRLGEEARGGSWRRRLENKEEDGRGFRIRLTCVFVCVCARVCVCVCVCVCVGVRVRNDEFCVSPRQASRWQS